MQLLTKLGQPGCLVKGQYVDIKSEENDVEAYYICSPELELTLIEGGSVEDSYVDAELKLEVVIKRGNSETQNDDDEVLAQCGGHIVFHFPLLEQVEEEELYENGKIFEVMLRSYFMGRLRPMLLNTPMQSTPVPLF